MDKSKRPRRIKALGEVSIRVKDLDAMAKFYEQVVGLQVLRRDESLVFFKIAEGYGGHSQILGLFPATNLGFLETKSSELDPVWAALDLCLLHFRILSTQRLPKKPVSSGLWAYWPSSA